MKMALRWKHSPPDSNWGEFGENDCRGRMNLVDHNKVLQGIAEVREGLTFCLSLPLDYPGGMALNPRRLPPQRFATLRDGASRGVQGFCWQYASEDPSLTDVVCDEVLLMNTQYSTQWDSLAHMGSLFDADGDGVPEPVFYNGFRAETDILSAKENLNAAVEWDRFPGPDAGPLGIDNLAEHGVQGRAVLIDLDAHFGRKRKAVGYDALMRVLEADHVQVERGDMVCLHTGFGEALMQMNRQPDVALLHSMGVGLDGHDKKLLNWIVDSGLACLIADNSAVELVQPVKFSDAQSALRRPKLPLHEHCLFKNGIHLGELWWLTPLARWLRQNGRSRFLLTAPPLRLPGAAGSPTTPIATV